jgi:hypothetical protein
MIGGLLISASFLLAVLFNHSAPDQQSAEPPPAAVRPAPEPAAPASSTNCASCDRACTADASKATKPCCAPSCASPQTVAEERDKARMQSQD